MNHELAVRLASTEVCSLSWREAENVIRTYLTFLAICPMCDGHGETPPMSTCERCAGSGRDQCNLRWSCSGEVSETMHCACADDAGCGPIVLVPQLGLVPTHTPLAEALDVALSREL